MLKIKKGELMNKIKVVLIDFIIFFLAFSIIDYFFADVNEIAKIMISVFLVFVETFLANKFFHYSE